jgi:hypothetical protein
VMSGLEHPTYPTHPAASLALFCRKQATLLPSSNAGGVATRAKCPINHLFGSGTAADKIRLLLLRVSRLRFTTSAQRVAGQSVNPRLIIFSVKKSLPLGHGRDGLVYPEATLLKIVSK